MSATLTEDIAVLKIMARGNPHRIETADAQTKLRELTSTYESVKYDVSKKCLATASHPSCMIPLDLTKNDVQQIHLLDVHQSWLDDSHGCWFEFSRVHQDRFTYTYGIGMHLTTVYFDRATCLAALDEHVTQ